MQLVSDVSTCETGLGAVNQNLLPISDYFIVPMHPDYFSAMAINSLASVIPKWRNWAKAAIANVALKEAEYPFPDVSPKFLGYVVQNYRPRSGAPSRAFQIWIDQLTAGVTDTLLPALRDSGMVMDNTIYQAAGYLPSEPILQMADFNSLIASSQQHQTPIFELTADQLGQAGRVLQVSQASQKSFGKLFEEAADRVIEVINADST